MPSLHVITAVPLNVRTGSGCYVAVETLVGALRQGGTKVELVTPSISTPAYTTTRVVFNQMLRWRRFDGDVTVGIDADGYLVAGTGRLPHVACIKGVIGDAVPFERGFTRLSMAYQARLEKEHARRADLVITISRYCAERLEELYGVTNAVVVPELIDLDRWRRLFRDNPGTPDPHRFTVLTVCRFYPRKRLDLLLRAAALLRDRIPSLQVRIVGNGHQARLLHRMSRDLRLESVVNWVGDLSIRALAAEYQAADVFCLPSGQEGFGLVFLEAMAAGTPIVATRAAAAPEVVRNGLLAPPDDPEGLADALVEFYRNPDLRASSAAAGLRDVEQYEKSRVAAQFLAAVAKVAPGVSPVAQIS